MKLSIKNMIYCLLIAAGISMGVTSSAADYVSINFTGKIMGGTCSVASGSDQMVFLGDVGITSFGNPGDVSPIATFPIVIECPEGGPTQVTVTFSGAAASKPELLALDAGGATGVAVRINDNNGNQIKLGTTSAVTPLISGENTLMYQAQYQSLVDRPQIIAGVANATAQFTINYP